MNAKFLRKRPESGEYNEITFSPGYFDDRWVLFEDNNYNEWVGIFGSGQFGCDKILFFPNTTIVFIIAKGKAYVIDIEKGDLAYEHTCDENLTEVFLFGKRDIILTRGNLGVYYFTSKKLCDQIDFPGIDRIIIKNQNNDIIKCEIYACMDIFNLEINLKTNSMNMGNKIGKYDYPDPKTSYYFFDFKSYFKRLYYKIKNVIISMLK